MTHVTYPVLNLSTAGQHWHLVESVLHQKAELCPHIIQKSCTAKELPNDVDYPQPGLKHQRVIFFRAIYP